MPLALDGKAGALRARPLNDPAACAESFEAPPRIRRYEIDGAIPLHTLPPQQDRKALRPSLRRDEGKHSRGFGEGAWNVGRVKRGAGLRVAGTSAEAFDRALSSPSRSDGEVDPSACEETEGGDTVVDAAFLT